MDYFRVNSNLMPFRCLTGNDASRPYFFPRFTLLSMFLIQGVLGSKKKHFAKVLVYAILFFLHHSVHLKRAIICVNCFHFIRIKSGSKNWEK